MKKLFRVLIYLLIGYLVGSYFPIRGFFGRGPSVAGSAELRVTVLRPDKTPATNLEVDIATAPGQPLTGGIINTDDKGVATFHVKPGVYYIFFNANNFPKDLLYKDLPPVTVADGSPAQQTINLVPNR